LHCANERDLRVRTDLEEQRFVSSPCGIPALSLELAALAAAPVVETVLDVLGVGLGLAGDAATHSRDSETPCLGDPLAAVLAAGEALPPGEAAPGAGDRILHARVDLVLHGSIASPADGHLLLLPAGVIP
jgi:hypothetical protein